MKNSIQQVIDQIGIEGLRKSMGDIALGNCDVHGHYRFDMSAGSNLCPICPSANGTTATEVEHYINVVELVDPASGANPGQVINPTGITEQDIKSARAAVDGR